MTPGTRIDRLLVLRGGAIGDFILTLPALRLLRDAFPEATLELVAHPRVACLAVGRFYARAARSLEEGRLATFFVAGSELDPAWVGHFRRFDLVLSYLPDADGVFADNLRRAGVKQLLTGQGPGVAAKEGNVGVPEHAAAHLAAPLRALGLTLPDPAARLFPDEADRAAARRIVTGGGESLVALHPGSGSRGKNWPLSCWIQLAEHLLKFTAGRLLLVGGEAEESEIATLLRVPSG